MAPSGYSRRTLSYLLFSEDTAGRRRDPYTAAMDERRRNGERRKAMAVKSKRDEREGASGGSTMPGPRGFIRKHHTSVVELPLSTTFENGNRRKLTATRGARDPDTCLVLRPVTMKNILYNRIALIER